MMGGLSILKSTMGNESNVYFHRWVTAIGKGNAKLTGVFTDSHATLGPATPQSAMV